MDEHSGAKKLVFSIIIPVLNESQRINTALQQLINRQNKYQFEIIVADGDPDGKTINAITNESVIKIKTSKGRAKQMNAAAATANAETLIFLHADTQLPENALEKITKALENKNYVGGAFDLEIDSENFIVKIIAACARFRSRVSRIPYGDQAIFIRKDYFDSIGRFRELPLMEDLDLMKRIKREGSKIVILPARVKTSGRRWEKDGVIYTTLRNRLLVFLYNLGFSPHKLVKFYEPHSP